MRPAIIVMVKAPRAGAVKTRLVPPLSAEQAAALAACFARDVVGNMRRIASDVVIAFAPANERLMIENILLPDLLYVEQRGGTLGERLANVAADVYARGSSPLIFTGTDSPTLPGEFIEDALRVLVGKAADVTLGATDDGGYYSIGLRHPYPTLFDNVSWSTAHVYRQTVANIEQAKLRLYELPGWYDVDESSDLARLQVELDTSLDARQRAPVTYRWLARLRELEHSGDQENVG